MALIVNDLLNAIDLVYPIFKCSRRSIFNNILLQDQEVIATDIDNYAFMRVKDLHLPKQVMVDGVALRKVLKSFKRSEDVIITIHDEQIDINGIKIGYNDPAEFPTLDIDIGEKSSEQFQLDTRDVDLVSHACSPDEDRVALQGVNVDLKLNQIAASNGHMLLAKPLKGMASGGEAHGVIAPTTLECLKQVKGVVSAQFFTRTDKEPSTSGEVVVEKWVVINLNTGTIFSKCTAIDFPDYQQVIPKSFQYDIPISSSGLVDFIKKAKSLAEKDRQNFIRFSIGNGKVCLKFENSNGNLSETLPVVSVNDQFIFGLGLEYIDALTRCLGKHSRDLIFRLNPGKEKDSYQVSSPVGLSCPTYNDLQTVIMPARVL